MGQGGETHTGMKRWNLLFFLYTLHWTLDHTPMCLGRALIQRYFWGMTNIPTTSSILHRLCCPVYLGSKYTEFGQNKCSIIFTAGGTICYIILYNRQQLRMCTVRGLATDK